MRREGAAEADGELSKGIDRFILSKSQFSLIDFLMAILDLSSTV